MTEQVSCPHILYLEPTGRKADYRGHEFPAVLIVPRDVRLAVKLGDRTVYINYLAIENTDNCVKCPNRQIKVSPPGKGNFIGLTYTPVVSFTLLILHLCQSSPWYLCAQILLPCTSGFGLISEAFRQNCTSRP